MQDTLPFYYTVAEAADILKVTPRTIYRYIDNGKLEATKTLGGEWRITQEAITSFIDGVSDEDLPLTPDEMKRMYRLFGKSSPEQLRGFATWLKINPHPDARWAYNAFLQMADQLEQETEEDTGEDPTL